MNERIKELAEQSTEKIHRFSYSLGHRTETIFDREKFAELIVRECAGLVQGVPTDTMGYHTADQKIKEHFGVKP